MSIFNKKTLCKTLCVLSAVSMFTACGSKSNDGESSSGKTTLKVTTWSNQASVDAIKDMAKDFMAKNTDIKVEVTDVETNQYNNLLSTRLQANDVDVMCMDGSSFLNEKVDWAPAEAPYWQKLCDTNAILDLTDKEFVKNWSKSAIEAGTYNNKVYAITTGANATTGIFYNKKMFADNGWELPKNWEDFMKLCETIKGKKIAPMTTGGADSWPYQMLVNNIMAGMDEDYAEFAKGLWTGDRKFTDDKSMEIFKRIEQLNNNMETGFMGIAYSEVVGRFVTGKAAMLPDGAWQSAEIEKADKNFEYGYFPMPGTKEGVSFQGKFDLYFAVNANSKNKDAAVKWMEFLSDKENYTKFVNKTGFIPTMADVSVSNEFVSGLLPYTAEMKNSWELFYRAPSGVGQYAQEKGFNGQYLKSAGGPVKTIEELAKLTQKDFDAAVKTAK